MLVTSDQSLADLHHILQIVMGWDDTHLHRFLIHGKTHGNSHRGGLWFRSNPKQIRLSDLHLRLKERFVYEYDLAALWQHQIRLEKVLPFSSSATSLRCISGARQAGIDEDFNSAAGTGSLLVTVGSQGAILTSTNGRNTWTVQYTDGQYSFQCVVWAGSQFVVVADSGTTQNTLTSP